MEFLVTHAVRMAFGEIHVAASRHPRGGGYFVRPFLPADVVTCVETPVLLTT